MRKLRNLAVSLLTAGLLLVPAVSASAAGCELLPGSNCTVDNVDTSVDVGVDHHETTDPPPPPPPTGDGDNGTGDGGGGGDGRGGGDGTDVNPVNDPRCNWGPGAPTPDFCFTDPEPEEEEEESDDEPPTPPTVVTASQLISFAPPAPKASSEPDGITIVNMPTNIVVPTAASSSSGVLLGFPVTVRFVPEHLAIDYGDGASVTVPAESARWSDLGQAEFTATATSHAYAERGTYSVSARVLYSASVDFGPYGTVPVTGYVSSAAATTSVRAVTAETGLVDKTCVENPSGPGC